jgi:hypothetical protein
MSLTRFLTIASPGFAVAWWVGIVGPDDVAGLHDRVGFFDLLERM